MWYAEMMSCAAWVSFGDVVQDCDPLTYLLYQMQHLDVTQQLVDSCHNIVLTQDWPSCCQHLCTQLYSAMAEWELSMSCTLPASPFRALFGYDCLQCVVAGTWRCRHASKLKN